MAELFITATIEQLNRVIIFIKNKPCQGILTHHKGLASVPWFGWLKTALLWPLVSSRFEARLCGDSIDKIMFLLRN